MGQQDDIPVIGPTVIGRESDIGCIREEQERVTGHILCISSTEEGNVAKEIHLRVIARRPDEDISRIGTYSHKIAPTCVGNPDPSPVFIAFPDKQLYLRAKRKDLLRYDLWDEGISSVIISRLGIVEHDLPEWGEGSEDEFPLGEVG